MATISGKSGEIAIGSSNLLDLTSWDLTHGTNIEIYAARSGGGAEETAAGLENGTGNLSFMVNTVDPITSLISSGDLVTLTLKHEATGPTEWTGQARIGQFTTNANRDGTMQVVSVPFTCHKTWTPPS